MSGTIALFGGTGQTGKCFMKLALEGGFSVQAMVRSKDKVDEEAAKNPNLTLIQGDFSKEDAIKATVKDAKYVVCMAGGPMGKPKEYPKDLMLNFFQSLTKAIQDSAPSVKVVLYQAGAFSERPGGKSLSLIQSAIKTVVGDWIKKMGPNMEDNTNVIAYIQENLNTLGFQTIVSRPASMTDKPSKDTLVADFHDHPNFPITFYDLAVWSLKAIQDDKLYGTFPYIQQQGKNLLEGLNKKAEPAITTVVQPITDAGQAVAKPVTGTTDMLVEGMKNADVK